MAVNYLQTLTERYPKGKRVLGRVTKVLPFGAFVQLDDGVRGVIRRRELSWAREIDPPEQFVSIGQEIEAIVLGVDAKSERLELSLRQALGDPWQEFIDRYKVGSIIRGPVVKLMLYGAFVEIMPGVDGLVHISQISPQRVERVEDVLWVGDNVEAVIIRIDLKRRKVELSIEKHLKIRELEARKEAERKLLTEKVMERMGGKVATETEVEEETREAWTTQAVDTEALAPRSPGGKIKRVLVVEDEREVGEPLADWLRRIGFDEVDTARSGEKGVALTLERDYDLVFMDLHLPGIDGGEATRRILANKPETQVVLITTITWAEEYMAEINKLDVVDVFLKPLDLSEIRQLVDQVDKGERPLRPKRLPREVEKELSFFQNISASMDSRGALGKALRATLRGLREKTGATACVLFHMDSITREVSIAAQDSSVPLNYEEVKYALEDSPVNDVINEHEYIFENDVKGETEAKFRYLLPLLNFNSCTGVPIDALGETHYGLFLFHPNAHRFNPGHFRRALATSAVIGAVIAKQEMEQRMREFQRFSLAGQLSAGLVHEINSKLSGLEIQLKNLLFDCEQLEKGQERPSPQAFGQILHSLKSISEMSSGTLEAARLFQKLIKTEERELVDINRIIGQAVELLKHTAYKNKVEIKPELDPDLPQTMAIGIRLEQAFLNIMLNAIQQIALKSPRGGKLVVTTSYKPLDGDPPLKIHFTDNGPGIHKQHFEKVFDLGFTTKEKGSGLGLFITKGLIESLGGRVIVEDSVMLAGTTFLVELPLVEPEEVNDE